MTLPPPPPPPPPMSPVRVEEGRPRPSELPPNAEVSGFLVCMNVINTVTHLLLGAVTFTAIFFVNTWPFMEHFTAHVYLTVIGYVLLISQAVLTFNPHTGWASNLKYPQKRIAHWLLQVLGSNLALCGSLIAIINTYPDNLQSAHGIVGFVAMILTVVSLVGGILNLCCPNKVGTVLLKTLHACVGFVTLTVAYIALCLAFDLIRVLIGNTNANLSIALTVFALLGTIMMTFANMARRGCIGN